MNNTNNNSISNISVTNNVTSDGQGHYVVYHTTTHAHGSNSSQQIIQQQFLPSSNPIQQQFMSSLPNSTVSTSSSGTFTRPRILARMGAAAATLPSNTFNTSGLIATTGNGIVNTVSQHQQQIHSVVGIVDDSSVGNFGASLSHISSTQTAFSDNRSSSTMMTNSNQDSNVGTNYTTLTAVDNYSMSNIYLEALPSGVDPSASTVLMPAENQLFNIPNNGGAVLFCPTTLQHGINLLPLIDTTNNPGTTSPQIHFPIDDGTGSGIYEFITLPSDFPIAAFSDQSITSVSSGASFASLSPKQEPSVELVNTFHESEQISTLNAMVESDGVQNSSLSSSPASCQTPAPSISMLPSKLSKTGIVSSQQHKQMSQKTIITVVDDFSDLIKTLPPGDTVLHPEQGTSFGPPTGRITDDETSGESSCSSTTIMQYNHEAFAELLKQVEEDMGHSLRDVEESDGNSREISIIRNSPTKQPEGSSGDGDSVGLMVVDDYFEEIKEPVDRNIIPVQETYSNVTAVTLQTNEGSSQLNTMKKRHKAAQTPHLLITDYTSLTLRSAMEKVSSTHTTTKLPIKESTKIPDATPSMILSSNTGVKLLGGRNIQKCSPGLSALRKAISSVCLKSSTKKFFDTKSNVPKAIKPKQDLIMPPPPLEVKRLMPHKLPVIPPHIRYGLSKPVLKLEWVDGVGTLPGMNVKFRVSEESGVLEMVDFNPAEHQRRIPLKAVKDENMPLFKKRIYIPKAKTFARVGKSKKSELGLHPLKPMKMKSKLVVPPGSGEAENSYNYDLPVSSSAVLGENLDEDMKAMPQEESGNVTFCINCSILASKDTEFIGRMCKKCFETQQEAEEESPSTKFKIPKGITITKTSKRVHNDPLEPNLSAKAKKVSKGKSEDFNSEEVGLPDVVYAKKSNPLPILKIDAPPVLPPESTGITVVPILQTPSSLGPLDKKIFSAPKPKRIIPLSRAKRRKNRRNLIEQRKLNKKVGHGEGYVRKRSFDKVLSTKTQYVTKTVVSGVVSDTKSHGGVTSESDDPSKSSQGEISAGETGSGTKKPLTEFNWTKYLQTTNSKAAPPRFFRQPAFPTTNPFKTGMMLEAVDPQHQSLFCVASVVDVQGHRLLLHLTGYSEMFDFWVNADSYDIFPPGWCGENGYKLEPPPTIENFNWHKYLIDEQLVPAEREFFAISKEAIVTPTDVQVGMKLEAIDIRNMSLTCVATVQNIINERLLIHFDSWDCVYDYWTDTSSPYIHPVGYCKKNGIELTPPKNYKGNFTWENYLQETGSMPVPSQFIRPLPPIGFKKGMKLECVDKRNPFLVRVATVSDTDDHQLLIHFDGWSSDYDYKVYECSGDIHPVGWCAATRHPLQNPPNENEPWTGACSVFGCLGLGHMKGFKFLTHNTEVNCPYSASNRKKDWNDLLPDRFMSYKKSIQQQFENFSGSRRGSWESQGVSGKVPSTKLRSEKRKSETIDEPVEMKRKIKARKSEPLMSKTKESVSDGNECQEQKESSSTSLLHKRLVGKPVKILTNLSSRSSKVSPMEPIMSLAEVSTRLILPNIESTITPVAPPTSSSATGKFDAEYWDDLIETVVKDSLRKPVPMELSTPEFTLPSSTTMTPIPTPILFPQPLSIQTTQEFYPRSPETLLMLYSQKAGGELTISQCTNNDNDSSSGDSTTNFRNMSPYSAENETDLPLNYVVNSRMLQDIVGGLNQGIVSKWKTKDVVEFIRRIPGCLTPSALFDEQKIDGEAFLLMTMTDFSEIMGLKMGPCIKLSHGIRLIQKNSPSAYLPPLSITPITTFNL